MQWVKELKGLLLGDTRLSLGAIDAAIDERRVKLTVIDGVTEELSSVLAQTTEPAAQARLQSAIAQQQQQRQSSQLILTELESIRNTVGMARERTIAEILEKQDASLKTHQEAVKALEALWAIPIDALPIPSKSGSRADGDAKSSSPGDSP